ncbi:MAG: C39 family peptidase [Tepidisphaeraceae bacterium]
MTVTWQRWVMLLGLSAFCVAQAYGPIFGDVPPVGPSRVVNGVHHQSTLSTCSAAAAATLLGYDGIQSTEAEMAKLCLTRSGGTLQLGLYRGLRIKAPRATVEFLNDDFTAVVSSSRPVIVSLGLRRSLWNLLQPRGGHSVVILGRTEDGRLQIADPMTGGSYPMPVG